MDSSWISKIEKAKEYAAEPERFNFLSFRVDIRGHNDTHQVAFDRGIWKCDCNYFMGHGRCSHTLAIEKVLGVMLPQLQAA